MAYKVVWTDPAVEDLEAAVEFFVQPTLRRSRNRFAMPETRSPSIPIAADVWRIAELSEFREIFAGSYRLVYKVERSRVLIAGIFHGRRDLPGILKARRGK